MRHDHWSTSFWAPREPGRRERAANRREVHAPEPIDPEVLSVLRRWTLRGWLATSLGERAIEELGQLPLVRHRHLALRRRAWERRDRCSAHDAFYGALAQVLDADLLTTDARRGRTARRFVTVLS